MKPEKCFLRPAYTVFHRWPELEHSLVGELGSVRITTMVVVLKACRNHREEMRLGTVWGSEGSPERMLVKNRPQHFESASTMGNCQGQQQQWSGTGLSLGDDLCGLQRKEQKNWSKPLKEPINLSHWILLFTLLESELFWFGCDVSWFFGLGIRKCLIYFDFTGAHNWENLNLFKADWIFKRFWVF